MLGLFGFFFFFTFYSFNFFEGEMTQSAHLGQSAT